MTVADSRRDELRESRFILVGIKPHWGLLELVPPREGVESKMAMLKERRYKPTLPVSGPGAGGGAPASWSAPVLRRFGALA